MGKWGGGPRQRAQQEHGWCIPGAVHAGLVKGDREGSVGSKRWDRKGRLGSVVIPTLYF